MSEITSLYVYKVISQASAGVDTRDLVEALGLKPDGPIDPGQMVGSDAYYAFFEHLADRDPAGVELPLRIGAAMRSDEYGAFGLAWKSAPNLRGSFVRSERYGHVLGAAETYRLEEHGESAVFSLEKAGDGRMGMLLSNEASLSAVVTISQEVSTANFTPIAVDFRHPPRGDVAIYERHFACPVRFETGRDAIVLDSAVLDVPNRLGDESIATFFDRHLEQELASRSTQETLGQQVRLAVAQTLSEGIPTVSFIAAKLAMSSRTLQRRLSDQGETFQNLVDLARRELAQKLLQETEYSLAEIAFLTGFSEQSAFTRAFKRWEGQTPRSFRLQSAIP